MQRSPALVAVVDDDDSIRESLPDLVRELGYTAIAFGSAEELLASPLLDRIDCLLLDVSLPGMTGPELQQLLRRRERAPQIVFITAQADHELCERLLAAGAIDCLSKPFGVPALVHALGKAVASHRR
ncbi:MAG TPA: response regulator [Gemmatimonadaceae bacterium]|jgi:FixJ family two-component response regulator